MTHWYVLRVQLRQERRIAALLGEMNVLAYCPIETRNIEVKTRYAIRIVPRTRALIPGYVFAVLPDDRSIDIARSIRLVRDIMADPFGKPRSVDLQRLQGLFLAEMFRCFDETYAPPKKKGYSHRWKSKDRVRIDAGAFEGWIGEVIKPRGRQQVEVMFSAFGKDHMILVDDSDLTQAPDVALRNAA